MSEVVPLDHSRGMLRAEGLVKRYGERTVVADVSLSVRPREIVGLLGPNGAGKTTTFYMIVGLVKADLGAVWIGSEDVTVEPVDVRVRRGTNTNRVLLLLWATVALSEDVGERPWPQSPTQS